MGGWIGRLGLTYVHYCIAQGKKIKKVQSVCRTYIVNLKNAFQYTLGADKYCLIPLIRGTWDSQIHRVRKHTGGCQGPGGSGNGEAVFAGDRVSV